MAEEAAAPPAAPTIDRAAADGRERHFPCKQCGAELVFPPGAKELACPYCGTTEAIPLTEQAIREFAFSDYLPPKKPTGTVGDGAFAPVCKPIHIGTVGEPALLIVVHTPPSTVNSTLLSVRMTP